MDGPAAIKRTQDDSGPAGEQRPTHTNRRQLGALGIRPIASPDLFHSVVFIWPVSNESLAAADHVPRSARTEI